VFRNPTRFSANPCSSGHSSIKVTFDLYGHLMPGAEAEAADLLDAYLVRADSEARMAALSG
jgi:hypothetical protein